MIKGSTQTDSMPMPPRNAENTGSPHMPENMYTSTAVRAVWSPKAMPHSMTAKVYIVNGTMPGTVTCEQIAMKDVDKAEQTIYCVFVVLFINMASIYRFLKKSVLDKMKFIQYILSYIKTMSTIKINWLTTKKALMRQTYIDTLPQYIGGNKIVTHKI